MTESEHFPSEERPLQDAKKPTHPEEILEEQRARLRQQISENKTALNGSENEIQTSAKTQTAAEILKARRDRRDVLSAGLQQRARARRPERPQNE